MLGKSKLISAQDRPRLDVHHCNPQNIAKPRPKAQTVLTKPCVVAKISGHPQSLNCGMVQSEILSNQTRYGETRSRPMATLRDGRSHSVLKGFIPLTQIFTCSGFYYLKAGQFGEYSTLFQTLDHGKHEILLHDQLLRPGLKQLFHEFLC